MMCLLLCHNIMKMVTVKTYTKENERFLKGIQNDKQKWFCKIFAIHDKARQIDPISAKGHSFYEIGY